MLFPLTAELTVSSVERRTEVAQDTIIFQNCFPFFQDGIHTRTTGRHSACVECAGHSRSPLFLSLRWMGGCAGDGDDFVAGKSEFLTIVKCCRLFVLFALASGNAHFFLWWRVGSQFRFLLLLGLEEEDEVPCVRRTGRPWLDPCQHRHPLHSCICCFPFFSPFAVFLLCQCSVYECTHACMHEVLSFRFCEWFVWNPKKEKNQILAALCCSCCKPEIVVQSTNLSHLEGKAHVFLPALWPGGIF